MQRLSKTSFPSECGRWCKEGHCWVRGLSAEQQDVRCETKQALCPSTGELVFCLSRKINYKFVLKDLMNNALNRVLPPQVYLQGVCKDPSPANTQLLIHHLLIYTCTSTSPARRMFSLHLFLTRPFKSQHKEPDRDYLRMTVKETFQVYQQVFVS